MGPVTLQVLTRWQRSPRMHAMETKYTARFATKNMNATIHSSSCSVVANTHGKHYVCFPVEGATAREAAQGVYDGQDFADRGIKFPKICDCAK